MSSSYKPHVRENIVRNLELESSLLSKASETSRTWSIVFNCVWTLDEFIVNIFCNVDKFGILVFW